MKTLFATRNAVAREFARRLSRVVATDLPVLLEGETGTGKSFLAARMHRLSRAGKPLVIVDCGAIPPPLLPSELFGHRAGAFTDATRARVGALARAGSGTLVLDRLDALAAEGQVALLRVLEERTLVPVGSATPHPFRARVIALVDAGVGASVQAGTFRADLFHRVAGFHASLPPLRERPEDIVPFARAVVKRRARAQRRTITFDREAEAVLKAYPWPGNFRELTTVLERACLPGGSEVLGVVDLTLPAATWPQIAALAAHRKLTASEAQRLYGLWVLAQEGGNVSRAARVLGVSRRTLIRWRGER